MSKNIVIIGATSAIAKATARLYAKEGANFLLVARNQIGLQSLAEDLKVRGAHEVRCYPMDACHRDKFADLMALVKQRYVKVNIVLIAHGDLPVQEKAQMSADETWHAIDVNGTSVVALATLFANTLEAQKGGTLAVISSVAGDRGRQSNYIYGAAKAMLNTFLDGLRHRLHAGGVKVVNIKPGFVDTPMTAAFEKGPLWAQPETVAEGIRQAIEKGKSTVYLPWFWRYIMLIIKSVPEAIFVKTRL